MSGQDAGSVGRELARRLREQTGICASLLELARKQGALIAANDGEELLRVLAEKQRLIERHQEIQKDAEVWRERGNVSPNRSGAPSRRRGKRCVRRWGRW
jgi:hypothetical protein